MITIQLTLNEYKTLVDTLKEGICINNGILFLSSDNLDNEKTEFKNLVIKETEERKNLLNKLEDIYENNGK